MCTHCTVNRYGAFKPGGGGLHGGCTNTNLAPLPVTKQYFEDHNAVFTDKGNVSSVPSSSLPLRSLHTHSLPLHHPLTCDPWRMSEGVFSLSGDEGEGSVNTHTHP